MRAQGASFHIFLEGNRQEVKVLKHAYRHDTKSAEYMDEPVVFYVMDCLLFRVAIQ